MASFFMNALQKGIYDALNGDSTLTSKIDGVYDFVPQGTGYPYVTIGADESDDFSSHTFDGGDVDVMVHVWSRGAGREDCKDVMGDVYRILHNGSITVSGFSVVLLQFDFANTEIDPDGQTYHGILRFRAIVTA